MCTVWKVTQPVLFSSTTGSEVNAAEYSSLALKLQAFCEDAFTLKQQVLR
jgi:hypothetical protein